MRNSVSYLKDENSVGLDQQWMSGKSWDCWIETNLERQFTYGGGYRGMCRDHSYHQYTSYYTIATSSSGTNLVTSQNNQPISLVGEHHFLPPRTKNSRSSRRPSNYDRTSCKKLSVI